MKKLLLPLLLVANVCFGQVDLNLGLRAYYPFTGNANDVSGNNNNPVFNNATLTADRLGSPNSAYRFNGTSSYIQIPNSPSLNTTNKLSLSAWIKPMGFYAGTCHGNSIISKGTTATTPGLYIIWYDDNAGTNGGNCSGPVNPAVQNFYGVANMTPPPGYTPYIQQNQWYNVIVTYDGITAKLYVDCVLIFSTPQGSINFTNTADLFLGRVNNASFPYWVNGDMDEVRIYDRALTVDEVNVLGGCAVAPGISGIINDYTPVLGLNLCDNKLTVEDASRFNTGDTVLLMQMKGAVIDSSNTANFGTITDYKNSGNYEFNYVKSRSGNVIELKNMVTRQYDIPAGKVQLVRVPYYTDININGTLTCLPWDGNKGGVLVFNVLNTLTLNANLDVSGRGFKGGPGYNPGNATLNCAQNNYNYPPNTLFAAQKGESITSISNNIICGKGSPAGGGGGGLGHNSGGGGGGNAGGGGFGGYQLEPCGNAPFDNRGIGGKELQYSTASNKIFMGSGGGAGHADNPGNIPPAGGNGGGLISIKADRIRSNSNKILANGDNGLVCSIPSSANCHDGMGGGGAGGSVLLSINQFLDNATSEVRGGKGADMIGGPIATAGRIGAGGGGGGGLTFVKSFAVPANLTIANAGGLNGVLTQDGNSSWGATSGVAGQNLFNLALPFSLTAFRNNIDSVRIKDSLLICNSYDFKGLAYINTSPITSWQRFFGDGGTANTQNTTHTYITGGTFIVKLVVSDINGCRDSISKTVNAVLFTADAGADTTVCSGSPATVLLRASAGISYAWTPAALLNNPALQNPTATINNTTRFYVTITNATGCTAQDSVLISLATAPANTRYPTLVAVPYQQLQLQARNIGGVSFLWLPNAGLDNNTIINPVFFYSQTQEYIVRITTTAGCNVIDTQLVEIKGKKGIYVPKGFTPNGDGNNDRLYPILIGIKQLNYFKIYNRWGNLLFETTSGRPEDGWDGTFKGKKQPVETYTWVVEGIDIDNLIIRKNGNTLLIH